MKKANVPLLPLTTFAYNNCYYFNAKMAQFEVIYGMIYRYLVG